MKEWKKILLKFFRPTFYHDNDKYYGHKRVQENGKVEKNSHSYYYIMKHEN
jgi:hypothetical protein